MPTLEEIKEGASEILQQGGVKRAAVFGSFARGETTHKSDLDLLIEFEGEKTLLDLVALKNRLERAIHLKVDLITYRSISPLLRENILREQIPLYG